MDKKSLRYLIVGFISGVLLAISFSVSAEQIKSVLGKKVTAEKNIEIENMGAPKGAIVVDNTTYISLKQASWMLGFKIKENSKSKIVLEYTSGNYFGKLKSSGFAQQDFMNEYTDILNHKKQIDSKIDRYKRELENNNLQISKYNDQLLIAKKEVEFAKDQDELNYIRNKITNIEKQVAEQNQQIKDYEQDIKFLEQSNSIIQIVLNHYKSLGKDLGIRF
ncbi:hypothetical protein B1A99_23965 [Cohnella sp. CIP 111063]|jgi:hypothetical protein|uniref:hypothetical protein n=1 Tax=unclassified Cohnella TaxID=2636738 RepID=UPI000B8BB52C|nr:MULTISPECIES: hypothetical protein [unclassified Cohnella]OXS55328.1 hypothetical protein B1A99_23965 [Cohnella sp. CIP 111063]PRX65762.1 hypothetical protein B0G52_117117 [Cohnella sp. SGD-V74]